MNDNTLHVIVSGHFSRNGNFIGIDSNNQHIHCYKVQMDLINLHKHEDINFPLFAFAKIKVFNVLSGEPGDADRQPVIKNGVNETFERLTAMRVMISYDVLIDVYQSEISFCHDVMEDLKAQALALGVTDTVDLDFRSELAEIERNKIEIENASKEYSIYKASLKQFFIFLS